MSLDCSEEPCIQMTVAFDEQVVGVHVHLKEGDGIDETIRLAAEALVIEREVRLTLERKWDEG